MKYNNQIIDTETPISIADISDIEKRFGITFPESVRNHYLAFNGGRPVKNLFLKDGEYFQIQEFLPIKHGNKDCLFEDTYQDLVADTPEFPDHLMPIAVDPGGDYYCVSMRPQDFGSIYCHMHDYWDDPSRAIVFMAASIEEFIDGMIEDEL